MEVREALQQARLYGIMDLGYVEKAAVPSLAQAMLMGGVQILQLRAKKLPTSEIAMHARQLLPLCHQFEVPFVLNDHPELAGEVGADAVHVGQDDLSVADARRWSGGKILVGKSTHSVAQAEAAQAEGADYIGFGPLFSTPTKPDYEPIGIRDIREVHRRVTLPIFCIGGIKRENLAEVRAAGAQRVVVVSGILQAENPRDYCEDCRALL